MYIAFPFILLLLLLLFFFKDTASHPVAQAGGVAHSLELLASGEPPAAASQSTEITGVSHRTQPFFILL